ncbi:MAG TPA: CoA ester lyase [Micromonosporaceae bacterium]
MRSWLYVPGDAPDEMISAAASGADAIVLDLADAVPPAARRTARKIVAEYLRERPLGPPVWVRINPGPLGHDDVRAVFGPGLRGFCLARSETPTQLHALDSVLREVEHDAGRSPRSVPVTAVLESAGAVLAAPVIARAPRVVRLQLGEADLRIQLGVRCGPDEAELLWARSQLVLASAAAGIEPPIGPAPVARLSADGLRRSGEALRRLGFCGRACLDTSQVALANEVFTPSAEDVVAAREVLDRYEQATADTAMSLDLDPSRVDESVVRAARRTLATAD